MSESNMPGPRNLLERLIAIWQGPRALNSVASKKFSEDDLDAMRAYFDADFYVGKNADVDFSRIDPLMHFLEFGRVQLRDPRPDFSIADYLEMYPDIRNSEINPFVHYVRHGKREGRKTKKDAGFLQDARCSPSDVENLRGFFDEEFYLARYPGLKFAEMDPVTHYIKQGEQRGRQPNCYFDPRYYRQRIDGYVENLAIHYLEQGQKGGIPGFWCDAGDPDFDNVCEAIDMEPSVAAAKLRQTYHDRRERFSHGELGEMLEKAAKLDPLITNGKRQQISQIGVAPFLSQASTRFASAMYQLQKLAGWRRAKVVVLVPCIQLYSASRVASHFLEALRTFVDAEDIVVLNTESSKYEGMDRFPGKCRYIDFSVFRDSLDADKQVRLLFEYLRSLVPARVINLDSALFWDVVEKYGGQLKDITSIGCYLFSNDNDDHGSRNGHSVSKFHVYQELIDVYLTDSQFLKAELEGRFSLSEDSCKRLVHLETPVRQADDPSDADAKVDRLGEPAIKNHQFGVYSAKVRELFEVPHG